MADTPGRRLILQMHVSLDGFVGTPSGDVGWIFPSFDAEYTAWQVESLRAAGTHVMGSHTGRSMAAYWPRPAAIDPRDAPFAAPMNETPKVVFSQSLESLDWPNTRIARGGLVPEIDALKAEPGNPILAHGGAKFAASLSRLGLVDEYHLLLQPVILGIGLRLFPEWTEPLHLELIEARAFPSGAVLHVSRPAPLRRATEPPSGSTDA